MTARTFADALAETLALLPEYTTDPAYLVAMFADGHRADLDAARRDERAMVEAEYAALWRSVTEAVVYPERGADRRVMAAEAGCRRDAGEWERSYVARARATPADRRTDQQRATCQAYGTPPLPGRSR